MLKLMQLEIKKFKFSGTIRGVIIANLIILFFLFMNVFDSKDSHELSTYADVLLTTGVFVRATFSIFAAVLISKLIIGEYKNKTINILFTYPINRKKVMIAKLIIILIFSFTTMIISNLFLDSSMFILNVFANFIQDPFKLDTLVKASTNILICSISFSFINLIPVFIGMIKKSSSATIVTSIILVTLLNNGNNQNSLRSIIIIPTIFALIGIIASYLSIKDVEKTDVANF